MAIFHAHLRLLLPWQVGALAGQWARRGTWRRQLLTTAPIRVIVAFVSSSKRGIVRITNEKDGDTWGSWRLRSTRGGY